MRVVDVQTESASPFAQSLLFGYVGQFLYEGDAPLAERRAQALALDTGLLAELLGRSELRELLDARGDDRDRGGAAAAPGVRGIRATSTAPPTCCAGSAT